MFAIKVAKEIMSNQLFFNEILEEVKSKRRELNLCPNC
jgi:hypothetical protein